MRRDSPNSIDFVLQNLSEEDEDFIDYIYAREDFGDVYIYIVIAELTVTL